jgi:hypothetical protein
VLLTGTGFNASSWYPHVAALAEDGPVYGIDVPGDPNPSVARALIAPPGELRRMAGRAPGQAQRPPGAPGRLLLRRLDRHEPGDPRARAGRPHHPARSRRLTKLDARFWFWLSISGLACLTPMPLRRRLARWLDSPSMTDQ